MASAAWVKLYSRIAESEDLADLYGNDPNAALLFVFSLPAAMPWGVLPGDARLFRAKVCPLFDVSLDLVKTALRLIVDSVLYQSYSDREGKQLLYVVEWGTYQDRPLERVALPVYDFPPNWTPPPTLAKSITDAARYKRPLTRAAIVARLQDAESVASLDSVLTQYGLSHPREERSERREVERTPTSTPLAPPPASPPAEPAVAGEQPEPDAQPDPPAPAAKAPKPAEDDTPAQAAIRRVWDACQLDGPPTPPKDAKGKSQAPAYTTLTRLLEKHGIPRFEKLAIHVATEGLCLPDGAKPWPWFVETVKEAMQAPWKWDPDAKGTTHDDGQLRVMLDDGSHTTQREWGDYSEFPGLIARETAADNWNRAKGVTKRPTVGLTCEDGYFYEGEFDPEQGMTVPHQAHKVF